MNQIPMFVFEGGECVGKSSIIRRLAEELSCPFHKRVRTPCEFQRLAQVIDDIKQHMLRTSGWASEALVLFDRWQLTSDLVYEQFCYNKISVFSPLLHTLGKVCSHNSIYIVYLKITEQEMLDRLNVRGDLLRTKEEAIMTRNAYDKMMQELIANDFPVVEIDLSGLGKEEAYQKVKNRLEEMM